MSVTSRPLRDEDDYQAVRLLLQRIYALDGPPDNGTVGDLDWWRATEDDPAAIHNAQIWFNAGGEAVGFAWPNGNRLDHLSHPNHRELEPEMVAWAEEQIRASSEHAAMSAFANDSHGWRQEQLQSLGFKRGDIAFRYWHRTLDERPSAGLPVDYVMRTVRGEGDLPGRVAAHRDAFAPSRMTVEKHRAVMASPTYRPDLDLVIEAPDGSIAAYCIVWLDAANAHGLFEPVGCHSAHRQRGLSKAVMFEGMRRLRDLGALTASVLSHPTEVAANRLYASVGFTGLDVNVEWIKQLT